MNHSSLASKGTWPTDQTARTTLILVNGHAVANATRNSQYGSLRSNKQPVPYQYQDQFDSYTHGDGRPTNQSANITSGRYDNSYGPDSETDSEDEIDKMKREVMERAQGQGSTSESDLDEGDQMIPRMRWKASEIQAIWAISKIYEYKHLLNS